jgi:peptide/nickel transport system permease protein
VSLAAHPDLASPRALRRLRDDWPALLGLIVIAATVVLAALAPVLAPADPLRNDLLDRLTPPAWVQGGSTSRPLGTDTLGRDVTSRLLYGARVSLVVGFSAVLLAGSVGVVLG